MSSLAASSGLGLVNEMTDYLFRDQHRYRCFVTCSAVTPQGGGTSDTKGPFTRWEGYPSKRVTLTGG